MTIEPSKNEVNPEIANDTATTSLGPQTWHVVQQPEGHCEICNQAELTQNSDGPKHWGPFKNRTEAIAKRVGLIRAGKCLPR